MNKRYITHKITIKIISTLVVCLFMVNSFAWAMPRQINISSTKTLQAELMTARILKNIDIQYRDTAAVEVKTILTMLGRGDPILNINAALSIAHGEAEKMSDPILEVKFLDDVGAASGSEQKSDERTVELRYKDKPREVPICRVIRSKNGRIWVEDILEEKPFEDLFGEILEQVDEENKRKAGKELETIIAMALAAEPYPNINEALNGFAAAKERGKRILEIKSPVYRTDGTVAIEIGFLGMPHGGPKYRIILKGCRDKEDLAREPSKIEIKRIKFYEAWREYRVEKKYPRYADRSGYGFIGGPRGDIAEAYRKGLIFKMKESGLSEDEKRLVSDALIRVTEGSMRDRKEFFSEGEIAEILCYSDFNIKGLISKIIKEKNKYEAVVDEKGKRLFSEKQINALVLRRFAPLSWIENLRNGGLSKAEAVECVKRWARPKEEWKRLEPVRDKIVAGKWFKRREANRIVTRWKDAEEKARDIKDICGTLIKDGLSKSSALGIVLQWKNPKKKWKNTLEPLLNRLVKKGIPRGVAFQLVIKHRDPEKKLEDIQDDVEMLKGKGLTESAAMRFAIRHANVEDKWNEMIKNSKKIRKQGWSRRQAMIIAYKYRDPENEGRKRTIVYEQLIKEGIPEERAKECVIKWTHAAEKIKAVEKTTKLIEEKLRGKVKKVFVWVLNNSYGNLKKKLRYRYKQTGDEIARLLEPLREYEEKYGQEKEDNFEIIEKGARKKEQGEQKKPKAKKKERKIETFTVDMEDGIYDPKAIIGTEKKKKRKLAKSMAETEVEVFSPEEGKKHKQEMIRHLTEVVLAEIADDSTRIAIRNKKVVGFVEFAYRTGKQEAQIKRITVSEEERDKGVGHSLMDKAVNAILEHDPNNNKIQIKAPTGKEGFYREKYLPGREKNKTTNVPWYVEWHAPAGYAGGVRFDVTVYKKKQETSIKKQNAPPRNKEGFTSVCTLEVEGKIFVVRQLVHEKNNNGYSYKVRDIGVYEVKSGGKEIFAGGIFYVIPPRGPSTAFTSRDYGYGFLKETMNGYPFYIEPEYRRGYHLGKLLMAIAAQSMKNMDGLTDYSYKTPTDDVERVLRKIFPEYPGGGEVDLEGDDNAGEILTWFVENAGMVVSAEWLISGNKTKDNASTRQIGKGPKVDNVDLETNQATATDSEGREHTLTLTAKGKAKMPKLKVLTESIDYENEDHRKNILTVLDLLENSLSRELPDLYTYPELIEDLFGFIPPDDSTNIIALHETMEAEPIARFHEIAHHYMERGAWSMEMKGYMLTLTINGTEQKLDVSRARRNLADEKEDWIKWTDDELNQEKNRHYLLRILQRAIFREKDLALTKKIKQEQKRREISRETVKRMLRLEQEIMSYKSPEIRVAAIQALGAIYLALIKQGHDVDLAIFEKEIQSTESILCNASINVMGELFFTLAGQGKKINLTVVEKELINGDKVDLPRLVEWLRKIYPEIIIKGHSFNMRSIFEAMCESDPISASVIRPLLVDAIKLYIDNGKEIDITYLIDKMGKKDFENIEETVETIRDVYVLSAGGGEDIDITCLKQMETILFDGGLFEKSSEGEEGYSEYRIVRALVMEIGDIHSVFIENDINVEITNIEENLSNKNMKIRYSALEIMEDILIARAQKRREINLEKIKKMRTDPEKGIRDAASKTIKRVEKILENSYKKATINKKQQEEVDGGEHDEIVRRMEKVYGKDVINDKTKIRTIKTEDGTMVSSITHYPRGEEDEDLVREGKVEEDAKKIITKIKKGKNPSLNKLTKALLDEAFNVNHTALQALLRVCAAIFEAGKDVDVNIFKNGLVAKVEVTESIREETGDIVLQLYELYWEEGQEVDTKMLKDILTRSKYKYAHDDLTNTIAKGFKYFNSDDREFFVKVFGGLTQDEDRCISEAAVNSLELIIGDLSGEEKQGAIKEFEKRLGNMTFISKVKAIKSLGKIYTSDFLKGKETDIIKKLGKYVNDEKAEIRVSAIVSIGEYFIALVEDGQVVDLDILEEKLEDKDAVVRGRTIIELNKIYLAMIEKGIVPDVFLFIKKLKDSDEFDWGGEWEDGPTVTKLEDGAYLYQSEIQVKTAAKHALYTTCTTLARGKINFDKKLLEKRLFDDDKSFCEDIVYVLGEIYAALAETDQDIDMDELEGYLFHEEESFRNFAAYALSRIYEVQSEKERQGIVSAEDLEKYRVWKKAKLPLIEKAIDDYFLSGGPEEYIEDLKLRADEAIYEGFNTRDDKEMTAAFVGVRSHGINISFNEFEERIKETKECSQHLSNKDEKFGQSPRDRFEDLFKKEKRLKPIEVSARDSRVVD